MNDSQRLEDPKEGPAEAKHKRTFSLAEVAEFLLGAELFIGPDLMNEIRRMAEDGVVFDIPIEGEGPVNKSRERE